MWIPKTKWAGAVMALVIVCFAFADCTGKADAMEPVIEPDTAMAAVQEESSEVNTEIEVISEEPESIDSNENDKTTGAETIDTSEKVSSTGASNTSLPSSTQAAPSTPAPVSPAPASAPAPTPPKYSVVGPDGRTYTGSEPLSIICICGAKFGSGAEWQTHRDYYSVFRCSCGATFTGIGDWEAHAGIYDPATWMYTGKTRAEASAEGHTLTNEGSYTSDYNAHNGWKTSNFTG